jgi:putative membrane protein
LQQIKDMNISLLIRVLNKHFSLFLKGVGMGGANVIPGVSGGTIALITGIFERLINAIKSFDLKAIRLLLKGKLKEFSQYTDLWFLISVFLGVAVAIISLARLFDYLFEHYPYYIWAYFFGLVLASIYFVGKTISKWNLPVFVFLILGTAIAVIISILNPASPNDGFFYLAICGVVAVCSMILPGLSGSFVLLLMGNYQLVAIDAINNRDFGILLPVLIGAVVGLIAFSHLLSWIFKNYRNQTIALLTGFILGSLAILWPWQREEYLLDAAGNLILKDGEKIVSSYVKFMPDSFNGEVIGIIATAIAGILSIWLVEAMASRKQNTN